MPVRNLDVECASLRKYCNSLTVRHRCSVAEVDCKGVWGLSIVEARGVKGGAEPAQLDQRPGDSR